MSDFKHVSDAAGTGHDLNTFQLGAMTIFGEAAQRVKQELDTFTRAACEIQGLRALDAPKSSAVVHEAGHAVLYAYYGIPMRYVKIWQCKKGIQRGHWVGRAQPVEYKWPIGPDASPEVNFKNACIQISGRIAEELFDTENLRLASSLDEVCQARIIAYSISQKTGVDPIDVLKAMTVVTYSVLKSNENVVREIASRLNRNHVVRREALGAILAGVQRPS